MTAPSSSRTSPASPTPTPSPTSSSVAPTSSAPSSPAPSAGTARTASSATAPTPSSSPDNSKKRDNSKRRVVTKGHARGSVDAGDPVRCVGLDRHRPARAAIAGGRASAGGGGRGGRRGAQPGGHRVRRRAQDELHVPRGYAGPRGRGDPVEGSRDLAGAGLAARAVDDLGGGVGAGVADLARLVAGLGQRLRHLARQPHRGPAVEDVHGGGAGGQR